MWACSKVVLKPVDVGFSPVVSGSFIPEVTLKSDCQVQKACENSALYFSLIKTDELSFLSREYMTTSNRLTPI